jgi:hypothetical protein
MFGSITAALVLGFVIYRALIATANKEREHLRAIFGAPYEVYERQTPLFWPKPTLYRDTQEVTFSPKALKRTFLDGMLFVLVFPVIEMIEHSNGLIPILMKVFEAKGAGRICGQLFRLPLSEGVGSLPIARA